MAETDKPSEHLGVEAFLEDLEKTLEEQLRTHLLTGGDKQKVSQFDQDMSNTIKDLNSVEDWMMVPTDKTNGWEPTCVTHYIEWMHGHLAQDYKEVPYDRLLKIYEEAKALLASFS